MNYNQKVFNLIFKIYFQIFKKKLFILSSIFENFAIYIYFVF